MQPRQTADRLLNRERNLSLDLFRRERRGDRVDLNLNRRRVRKCIDVKVPQRKRANDSK